MKKRCMFSMSAVVGFLTAMSLIFSGCPESGIPEEIEIPDDQNTGDSTYKKGKGGNRVWHTIWLEPVQDPRLVMGYRLDNDEKTPLFDHVVILYGMRLRNSICSRIDWPCSIDGLHACLTGNMLYYMEHAETYLKPIQDNGQKVIVSLVPGGLANFAVEGAAVGSLFNWPNERTYPWDRWANGREYPGNEENTYNIIDFIAEWFMKANIDGIAYDEEYGGDVKFTNPNGGGNTTVSVYGGTSSDNLLRFAYELNQEMKRRGRTENLIQEIYETKITLNPTATFKDRRTGEEVTVYRDELITLSYMPNYGGWLDKSTNPGFPNNRFGPASVAVSDIPLNSPRPPPGRRGNAGIINRMERHLRGKYGVVMYYGLGSRAGLESWPQDTFGESDGTKPETYFSSITEILYDHKTIYVGEDYDGGWK